MSDQEAKRQLSGLPSGKNTLADMQFSIRRFTPKTEGLDLTAGFEFFTAARLSDRYLADAVDD